MSVASRPDLDDDLIKQVWAQIKLKLYLKTCALTYNRADDSGNWLDPEQPLPHQ